ncbi:hypothetical protein KSP40_PGU010946 [Platanthera guangdongensis]|uniref:Uncharacterized protein n=1 Tax=Platanthera guangdongensis TaxID=2320717 RepID=A0ABR2N1Q6_9ASPA
MHHPEIVPVEETVEALIDSLVTPFLRHGGSPTLEQQESVAKQMYTVVVLYNYYHRRMFPKLEFLDFMSFCKVACISKSLLLKYMNAMYKSDMSSDLDEPLSITERMIMDACNVSLALDASKKAPDMNGWPISKVAVFLIDPSKEYCLLRSSGKTQAIMSIVEKDLETPLVLDTKNILQTKTNANGSSHDKINCIEDILQEAAFSVVEKEMGISRSKLRILGSHLSYSLSHLKSSSRLYIMSYTEPIGNQILVKTVMQSLQGPIVKINGAPEITPVIQYYSLLPYSNILSDCLSRTINFLLWSLQRNSHDPIDLSNKFDMMSVLQMLKNKRDELCQQQRLLEDDISHCEMSILTLLIGNETSASKVDSLLEICESLLSNEMKKDTNLSAEAQCQKKAVGRKKLCEAILCLQSPCQELDDIFCRNNWILPKYCVIPSSDGKVDHFIFSSNAFLIPY